MRDSDSTSTPTTTTSDMESPATRTTPAFAGGFAAAGSAGGLAVGYGFAGGSVENALDRPSIGIDV